MTTTTRIVNEGTVKYSLHLGGRAVILLRAVRAAILATWCECCLVLCLSSSGPAVSADLEYALRGGVSYSDNVERLQAGAEDASSAAVANAIFNGQRSEGRLRYDVAADVSWYDYRRNGLESEILGGGFIRGEYDFLPDALSWNAELSYDQIREDALRAGAIGNREGLFRVSTGPSLTVRPSGQTEARFDALFSRIAYGKRPYDTEALGGRVLIGSRASPRSLVAVGVSYDDVSYLSAASPVTPFRRREVFSRFETSGVRTEATLELGYADISGSDVGDSGVLMRAELSRKLSPSLTGYLELKREFPTSDPLVSPRSGGAVEEVPDNALLTAGARLATAGEFGLRLTRSRSGAQLSYARQKEDGRQVGAGIRNYQELELHVSRVLSPRLRAGLYGRVAKDDFPLASLEVRENVVGGEVSFDFGSTLGVDFKIERRHRDSPGSALGYQEVAGWLLLRYSGLLARRGEG
jgi:hypothetical protein